jgi:glycosyltransferase involved in cell wall biosynthesis
VSARPDAARVRARLENRTLGVIPNAVAMPASRKTECLFDLLFLGNLSYAPNEDAALWLCEAIAPNVARRLERTVRVGIVGSGPSARVRALGSRPGVTVEADVEDVSAWYAASNVVVVPIRAGGGMRIKVLEAFAHRRPLVTTSIGAEGVEISDGVHAFVADDADAFAAACARLLDGNGIAPSLTETAYRLVSERYSLDVVHREIEEYMTSVVDVRRNCR